MRPFRTGAYNINLILLYNKFAKKKDIDVQTYLGKKNEW